MRDFLKRFFSNKLNIVLTILQVVVVVFFLFGNVWNTCLLIAIVIEGVFFVTLGIKSLFSNKFIRSQESLFEKLPMQKAEIESLEKSNNRKIKSNKLQAVLYMIMGIVLVFLVIF